MTYTVTVTNGGALPIASITATDTLPDGAAFTSATGDASESDGVITWNVGTLEAGQSMSYTVTGTVTDATGGTTRVNRFTASGVSPADPTGPAVPGVPTPGTVCDDDPDAACAATEVPLPPSRARQ